MSDSAPFMPPEWALQDAVFLSAPLNPETWPAPHRVPMEEAYASFAAAISRFETLYFLCNPSAQDHWGNALIRACADMTQVQFLPVPTNDAWCRDHGPTVCLDPVSGERVFLNFRFNAWGGKFPPWDLDDQVPEQLGKLFRIPVRNVPLVCEGGALEVNGAGTLLSTRSVLFNRNRNPHHTEKEITSILLDALGMKQLLLLDSGLDGDDTDGHIDTLARFVRDDVVLAAVEPRPDFPNHRVLTRNAEFLRTAKLHDGRTLEVIPLPSPDPIRPRNWREKILPATYANFLLLNNAVLLPTYAQKKADDTAAGILRALFPDREIIGIDCSEILLEGGALHCLSQQLPARRPTA